jgi:hypothetical protein
MPSPALTATVSRGAPEPLLLTGLAFLLAFRGLAGGSYRADGEVVWGLYEGGAPLVDDTVAGGGP